MIIALPYSTAEIIGSVIPRKISGPGIVEKRLDEGVYVISLPAGKVTVKISSGSLSEGDAINVTQRGNELVLQKTGTPAQSGVPAIKDAVDVNGSADPDALRTIVDTVVDQLKKRVLDKPTLDQLQRILAAVSKSPEAFDAATQKAVSELKSMVSSMRAGDPDLSKAATEITDRIIALGEKIGQGLKSAGGAIDIVLKPDAKLEEGYYKFDSIKTALSWIVKNKAISADIPWQKLSVIFKDGPVVLKVYESAIGDNRASLISPDKVDADIGHFIQSNLKANAWKNISDSVLVNLLIDRKEIPFDRLLQIDKLLSADEGVKSGVEAQGTLQGAAMGSAPVQPPKGLEAAFGQWLAIALDKNSPMEALAERTPAFAPARINDLLGQIDASGLNTGVASSGPLEDEGVALDRSTLVGAKRPETVIIDAFRRLGLDLESALLKSQSNAGPDTLEQNLKARLLSLQSAIDSATSQTGTPEINKVLTDNKAVLRDIAARLDTLAREFSDTAAATRETEQTAGQMQSPGTAQQRADKIKDLADLVQNFAKQLAEGESGLPKAAIQTGQRAEIELLSRNIVKQLDVAVKSPADGGVRLAPRDIAARLTDLAEQTAKLAEKLVSADRGPLDTLKQQVEQVLTRVESMQVLAKQVIFSDSQQQVISLPMKIEGQWTDVVVKFMKKGPSEKKQSGKNVSVVIHVAPTLLGEITVFMDYSGKKNFSMRMEFEKTSSRQWFENNRAEFSKAIGKFGFSSFKIDMKTGRDRQPVDTVTETASPTFGTIDIKA